MASIICMDGLGGNPEVTFSTLKKFLESFGHTVHIISYVGGINTHQDRVDLVINEYYTQARTGASQIFLAGQSAGGSAVRIAAEYLGKKELPLSGVIQLSPAMPRGIIFMTSVLWKTLRVRVREILFGKVIISTEQEYEALVSPLPEDVRYEVVHNRQPISGKEGRTLALFPPSLKGYSFPTLHIYGEQDVWIAPSAQRKLSKMLSKYSDTTTCNMLNSGHLTLMSDDRNQVLTTIQKWVHKFAA